MTKRILRVLCCAVMAMWPAVVLCQQQEADQSRTDTFRPVAEDVVPFRSRLVSVDLRDTPIRDALYSIAQTTGLNLVMQRGVDPDHPVTLSVSNIPAQEAVDIICNAAGYFYRLKNNILTISAMGTRVFEFGQPAVNQEYSVEVGGDMLGAVIEGVEDFGEGGGGGGGSGSEDSQTGKIKQTLASDSQAFNFWEAIERALQNIIGASEESAGAAGFAGESSRGRRPYYDINRMAGTVMVTADRERLEQVEHYINSVKQALHRQVIIEARIIEVQLAKGLKYGIDWTWLASDSVTIQANNFRDIVNPMDANVEVHVSRSDFDGVLRAIERQGQVNTLSNPRLNIMNGQSALLSVGRSQSFLSSLESEVTTGDNPVVTYTTNTSSVLSGMAIGIVPYISSDGQISMSITPIISELISMEERQIGDQGTSISLPTVDLRQMSTTVKVADGEMIIIGGLMQTKKKAEDEQVPFVGNIPLVGYLFKRFEDVDEQTDIVILLKPHLKKQRSAQR